MSSAVRAYIYSTLKSGVALAGGRVFQQGSIISAQQTKPYLVYHFGNYTDEGLWDTDGFKPSRQYLQTYIHVDQGDYGPVDDIIDQVKTALDSLSGKPNNLIEIQYLETSQDLEDDVLQTYCRYVRHQLILTGA